MLFGEGGGDRFEFGRADGRLVIYDFGRGDRIDITSGANSFDDLKIGARGGDAVVRFARTLIVVEDAAGALDAGISSSPEWARGRWRRSPAPHHLT